MSSLLTSEALVQKCYIDNPIAKNTPVKISGYDSINKCLKITPVFGNNDKILGLTLEDLLTPGSVDVIYKGLITADTLPSGTFINSQIYWDTFNNEFTSTPNNLFVGTIAEVFPNKKIYVDILNAEESEFTQITEKTSIVVPPVTGTYSNQLDVGYDIAISDIFQNTSVGLYELYEPTSGVSGTFTYLKFYHEPSSETLILRESSDNVKLAYEPNCLLLNIKENPVFDDDNNIVEIEERPTITNTYSFPMNLTVLRFK